MPEVFKGLDRHDPVDGLAEILPAMQPHVMCAVGVECSQHLLGAGVLVLGQCQADDVDVILLDGSLHRGAPAAADVQQRHARLEVQLVQVEVDFGDLGFFEGELRRLEVGAAVDPARILEKGEEVIGDVVVRLDIFGARPRLRRTHRLLGHCCLVLP